MRPADHRRGARLVLLAGLVLLLPLGGCGDAEDVPDPDRVEILETYGEGDDADRMVLDQLAEAGSDLTRPTNVRWYVYFPVRRSAEAFAALAREAGWDVERRPGVDGGQPLCLCARRAVPTLDTIRAMRDELTRLAQGLKPDIDGWEAAVQR